MSNSHYPRFVSELTDLEATIEKYVLPEFLPERPIISRESLIRTQGSCFADNINEALNARSYKSRHFSFPEAVNSPLANAALLSHVLDSKKPYDLAEHEGLFPRDQCTLLAEKIRCENLFILTLGLAPAYYRKGGSKPTFKTMPAHIDDYEMRHTDVDQNVSAIDFIIQALRILNPAMQVVLTISPVPLNRAYGLGSAVCIDAVSKATLCVATSQYMRMAPAGVFYWPSFEIVRWLAPHASPAYGADDGMTRHVNRSLVELIVKLFLKHYAGETAA